MPAESSVEEALWGTRVSPSTVSDLNQQLYERIDAWRSRPHWKTRLPRRSRWRRWLVLRSGPQLW